MRHALTAAEVALLKARAAELAARGVDAGVKRASRGTFVIAERAGASLAWPIEAVVEVARVRVAPLPGGTAVVEGLFHLRGRVLCLVDLLPLMDPERGRQRTGETLVIVVEGPPGALGVRVDLVLGAAEIFEDECQPARQEHPDFVEAITRELVAVLSPTRFFGRPELVINQV